MNLCLYLYNRLVRMEPPVRAQLLARAPQFITNTDVLNLLNRIDINNVKTFAPTINLLRAFEADPATAAQLDAWLSP